MARPRVLAPAVALLAVLACGKKGPPLPPIEAQPGTLGELAVAQWGDRLAVAVLLPAAYRDGAPFTPERLEVLVLEEDRSGPSPRPTLPPAPPLPLPTLRATGQVDPLSEAPPGITRDPIGSPTAAAIETPGPAAGGAAFAFATPTPAPDGAAAETPGPSPAAGVAPGGEGTSASAPLPAHPTPSAETLAMQAALEREQRLRQQFPGHARRAQVVSGAELMAALSGRRAVLLLPLPAEPGKRVAVAVRARGDRAHAAAAESAVAVLELVPPGPAPAKPGVESSAEGVRVFTGASAGHPRAVYRRAEGESRFAPYPLRRPGVEPVAVDAEAPLGASLCYAVAEVLEAEPGHGGRPRAFSALSEPACIDHLDRFPPPAPGGLRALAGEGSVVLLWDPVGEGGVAGYLVYRSHGGRRERLTATPIVPPSYTDRSIERGESYDYEVTAVDGATPPNESLPSRVSERVPE